jgi:hypothetical protein
VTACQIEPIGLLGIKKCRIKGIGYLAWDTYEQRTGKCLEEDWWILALLNDTASLDEIMQH